MKHRGEIIEKAVRESGISITTLAKRLNCSRRHIYNIFNEITVDIDTILQIGKIIHFDFSKKISEIKSTTSNIAPINFVNEPNDNQKNTDYWKEKYFELLEKYNSLLESLSIAGYKRIKVKK